MTSTIAYVGIGSNIEPGKNIPEAVVHLARLVQVTGVSRFYRSEAIGRPEQPEYVNGVCAVEVACAPLELKFQVLRKVEEALGRERRSDRYAPRTIDLDLLLYGDVVANLRELTLPDPDILHRPFLLAGLRDLGAHLGMFSEEQIVQSAAQAELEKLRIDDALTRLVQEKLRDESAAR